MTCRNCDRDVSASDRFCPWCGTPDPGHRDGVESGSSAAPAADAGTPRDSELRDLRATINSMTAELAWLSLRLGALERGRPGAPAPRQPQAEATDAPRPEGLPSPPSAAAAEEAPAATSRQGTPLAWDNAKGGENARPTTRAIPARAALDFPPSNPSTLPVGTGNGLLAATGWHV